MIRGRGSNRRGRVVRFWPIMADLVRRRVERGMGKWGRVCLRAAHATARRTTAEPRITQMERIDVGLGKNLPGSAFSNQLSHAADTAPQPENLQNELPSSRLYAGQERRYWYANFAKNGAKPIFGRAVRGMSWPCGSFNETIREICRTNSPWGQGGEFPRPPFTPKFLGMGGLGQKPLQQPDEGFRLFQWGGMAGGAEPFQA